MDKTQRRGGAVQCLDFRHNKILIGVVVLESFGFEVDPATGKLKERPLLLYQAKSSIALIGRKLKRISRE